jgi:Tfp pilus assembly major pilin PilA
MTLLALKQQVVEKTQVVTLLIRYATLVLAKPQVRLGLLNKKQNGRDAHVCTDAVN